MEVTDGKGDALDGIREMPDRERKTVGRKGEVLDKTIKTLCGRGYILGKKCWIRAFIRRKPDGKISMPGKRIQGGSFMSEMRP